MQLWQPPPNAMIKINTDKAFRVRDSHAGWGVVARDIEGNIVAARAGRQDHICDIFGAEAHAMTQAIAMAAELGMIRVVFETDSQLLADALDLWKVDSSPYAAIIEDSKFQLKLWFSKHVISACRRSANHVAHELVGIGRMYEPNHYI